MATETYDMDAFLEDSDDDDEPSSKSKAAATEPALAPPLRCTQCGSEIQPGRTKCDGCGAAVPPPLPSKTAKPALRSNTGAANAGSAKGASASTSPSSRASTSNKASPRAASQAGGVASAGSSPKSGGGAGSGARSTPSSSPRAEVHEDEPMSPGADFEFVDATDHATATGTEDVDSSVQDAGSDVSGVPAEHDDGMREMMMRLCQDLQSKFVFTGKDGVRAVDVTNPLREFIRDGELKKKGTQSFLKRDSARRLFVFKDLIVVTHPEDRKGLYQVSGVINLAISTLTDLFADEEYGDDENSFKINDPSSREYVFVAKDERDKKMWLHDLARIIESNMDPSITSSHIGFTHTLITGSVFSAAVTGRRDQMARLLSHPNCRPNIRDESGRYPIHYAVELQHVEVLRVMLVAGKSGKNLDVNVQDAQGRTALEVALDMLSAPSLEVFYTSGYIKVERSHLLRAMRAFSSRIEPGEPEEDAIDIMLKRGGDGVKSSNLLNIGTLLHCATSIDGPGQNALVDFLLQHGFDANAPADGDGARPLHSACRACQPSVVTQLLNAGAQPNGRDKADNTALHALFNSRGVPPQSFITCDDDPDKDARRIACAQEVASFGGRVDIANAAGVTVKQDVSPKTVRDLEAAKRRFDGSDEPPSAAKWSRLFPCQPQTEWAGDENLPNCEICGFKFTFVQRKHHCRFCSQLVCDACSKQRFSLLFKEKVAKERVDDGCFNFLCHRSRSLDKDPELVRKMKRQLEKKFRDEDRAKAAAMKQKADEEKRAKDRAAAVRKAKEEADRRALAGSGGSPRAGGGGASAGNNSVRGRTGDAMARTQQTMADNIDKAVERGEKINEIQDSANQLANSSNSFLQAARALRERERKKDPLSWFK